MVNAFRALPLDVQLGLVAFVFVLLMVCGDYFLNDR